MDTAQLLKFLRLTASDQEGEVVAAIRAANRLLTKHGQTWDDVVREPSATRNGSHLDATDHGGRLCPGQSWAIVAHTLYTSRMRIRMTPREGDRLADLAFRLQGGTPADHDDKGFLLALYERVGGTVRRRAG